MSNDAMQLTASDAAYRLERTFKAPRRLDWNARSEADWLAAWWQTSG